MSMDFFPENTLGDGPKIPRIRVNSYDTVSIFQPKSPKMPPFNEFQFEKFFKTSPLKFQAGSFGLIIKILGKILLPNFTGSEPEMEIFEVMNPII